MAITRVFIPTITNTGQLQQQINTALENIYDDADLHPGTVTKVDTGTGLTGGPVTVSGSLSIDQAAALHWTSGQTIDKLITPALTFATLPATPTPGQRAFITDGAAATFGTKAAGGGANEMPLTYTTGLGWIYG